MLPSQAARVVDRRSLAELQAGARLTNVDLANRWGCRVSVLAACGASGD